MIPVGAIVVAVVFALRALNNAQGNTNATSSAAPTPVTRGTVSFWSDGNAGGTVLLQLLLYSCWAPALAFSFSEPLAFPIFVFLTWMLWPAWIARRVFAPLGLVRLAYFSAWMSRVQWRRDKPGGPALIAAWALAKQKRPSADAIAWVEERLTNTDQPLQASGVAAYGLLEAAKGRHESAREWLESVVLMDPRIAVKLVRRIAVEWLATDAAARGDWKKVKSLALDARWPKTATLRLLEALADRIHGERLPTNSGLWLWWVFSPNRLWSRAFVSKMTAHRAPPRRPEGLAPPPPSLDALGRATFLSLALKGHEKPTTPAVVQVANAWDDALGNDVRSKLFARSTLIGGGDPDEALDEVRTLVQESLSPVLSQHTGPLPDDVPLLVTNSLQGRRDELSTQLEDRIGRMEERKTAQRELPAVEEWREVLALVKLYKETASLGERALAHSTVKDTFVNYGAWLYNARDERAVANAVFTMLRDEAKALSDAEAERLNTKNANCDL